ncbi:MAG: hypothetical protein LM514_03920 [Streptococcus sp.]|nr:hypothetical protein [Streptococcus sp.]
MHTLLAQFAKNGFQVKMPRYDPTFTDIDLIRFYCTNLDPAEKARVLDRFVDHIINKNPICPNEPPKEDEDKKPCDWVKLLKELVDIAAALAKILAWLIAILATIEVALSGAELGISIFPQFRPIAYLLRAIKYAIGVLIPFLIYITAVFLLIEQLGPFLTILEQLFCKGEAPDDVPPPPSTDELPPAPTIDSTLTGFIDEIKSYFDWILPE